MKLVADECIDGRLVDALLGAGHGVELIRVTARGVPDEAVLARAFAGGAVLVTEDKDFGDLTVRREQPTHGVILLRLDDLPIKVVVNRVVGELATDPERFIGSVCVIDPARTRFRTLYRPQNAPDQP